MLPSPAETTLILDLPWPAPQMSMRVMAFHEKAGRSRVGFGVMLLWVGTIMGMFVNGAFGCIGGLMSEAYPTVARTTS